MTYIISTAESEFNTYWKPSEYRRHYLRWKPEQVFEWVARDADPAGTWQEWGVFENKIMAEAEMNRMKHCAIASNEIDRRNGHIVIASKVFKLERDNEDENDPNQIELLDWYAEGFEHEPEDEGGEE